MLFAEGLQVGDVHQIVLGDVRDGSPRQVHLLGGAAANGIENPRILLSSGAANSSDKVGRYLMDHPIKQSYALATRPLFPFRGPQTTSDIEAFRDGDFRRTLAAFKTSIKNDGWSTVGASGAKTQDFKFSNPAAK